MQLLQGDLFKDFPTLRFIIPHGGGAVPYHWGRYRGLADMLKQPPPRAHHEERLLRHLRLPPARHRPAASTSSTSTTSCSARRWSARCAASTPRPATTSTTPSATSTRSTFPAEAGERRLRRQRAAGLSAPRRQTVKALGLMRHTFIEGFRLARLEIPTRSKPKFRFQPVQSMPTATFSGQAASSPSLLNGNTPRATPARISSSRCATSSASRRT